MDLTGDMPCILRQGYINEEMLREAIGDISSDPGESEHPRAPGMKYRHYAPKGELTVVRGDAKKAAALIHRLAEESGAESEKIAVISSADSMELYSDLSCRICDIGSREDEDTIARRLFAILRELDDLGIDHIYSESFDTPRLGRAIMDRLYRAAGGNITEAD